MSIENLTIGEAREIAALFGAFAVKQESKPHPFVGKFVIARCYSAGVHAGTVVSADGENVILKDSVRLWSWKAKEGIALSGVAQNGIEKGCKLDSVNPEIYLTGVAELIPATDKSKGSIYEK